MRSPEALEEALDFTINEFARYARMTAAELLAAGPDVAFKGIVDWQGQRRLIGSNAAALLVELAEETLAASVYHRRVARNRATESVFKVIGERYFNPDRRMIDGAEIARDLNDAVEEAGRDCATRTHYIPCAIHIPTAERIVFGPVTIRPVNDVMDSLSDELKAYSAKGEWERKHAVPVVDYYRAFPDVAVVIVAGCDEPTSKTLANQAVQAALDAMHVLAGAPYSRKMRAGGPALDKDRRGEISKADDGLRIASSIHVSGGANLAESWWQQLREQGTRFSEWIGEPIAALVQGRDPELFGGRFLDSAAWYGDAARDRSPAAAIVKYLTAMERLLWAGDKKGSVTRRIAERAAALCFSTETWNFNEIETEVRKAYDIRSDLVHGRISPADPVVLRSARLCERVAKDLLKTWLDRFGPGFGQPFPLERLKAYFEGFVGEVRQAVEQAAALSKTPEAASRAEPTRADKRTQPRLSSA